eukprot:scaffold82825_cov18-Tisochrysis_lutea.AAC.1
MLTPQVATCGDDCTVKIWKMEREPAGFKWRCPQPSALAPQSVQASATSAELGTAAAAAASPPMAPAHPTEAAASGAAAAVAVPANGAPTPPAAAARARPRNQITPTLAAFGYVPLRVQQQQQQEQQGQQALDKQEQQQQQQQTSQQQAPLQQQGTEQHVSQQHEPGPLRPINAACTVMEAATQSPKASPCSKRVRRRYTPEPNQPSRGHAGVSRTQLGAQPHPASLRGSQGAGLTCIGVQADQRAGLAGRQGDEYVQQCQGPLPLTQAACQCAPGAQAAQPRSASALAAAPEAADAAAFTRESTATFRHPPANLGDLLYRSMCAQRDAAAATASNAKAAAAPASAVAAAPAATVSLMLPHDSDDRTTRPTGARSAHKASSSHAVVAVCAAPAEHNADALSGGCVDPAPATPRKVRPHRRDAAQDDEGEGGAAPGQLSARAAAQGDGIAGSGG